MRRTWAFSWTWTLRCCLDIGLGSRMSESRDAILNRLAPKIWNATLNMLVVLCLKRTSEQKNRPRWLQSVIEVLDISVDTQHCSCTSKMVRHPYASVVLFLEEMWRRSWLTLARSSVATPSNNLFCLGARRNTNPEQNYSVLARSSWTLGSQDEVLFKCGLLKFYEERFDHPPDLMLLCATKYSWV